MTVTVSAKFRLRRDTAANWTSTNPVLLLGEPGVETDTRKMKFGDGSTAWTGLSYISAPMAAAAILAALMTVDGAGSGLDADLLDGANLDTDGTLAANSDTRIASQKATKTYVDQIIAAQDAMVFKGVIDCSANPNYPAADRGHTYRVSVAGKIGGASGINVEIGDLLLCLTDGTAAGNQAAVGANWAIAQTNLDGAVIGPASATDASVAGFNGTSGKLVKQLSSAEIRAAADFNAATTKIVPVDTDQLPLVDSAASNVLKKLSWANLKVALNLLFGQLAAANTWTVQQIFSNASGLTSRFVGTSAGSGTAAISLEQTGFAQKSFAAVLGYDTAGCVSFRASTSNGGDPYAAGVTFLILPAGALGDYVNDAAAATGGVPVKGLYRNGSVLMIRVT